MTDKEEFISIFKENITREGWTFSKTAAISSPRPPARDIIMRLKADFCGIL